MIRLSTLLLILWLLLLVPKQSIIPKKRRLLIWLILLWLRVAKCSKRRLSGITLSAEYRRLKVGRSYRIGGQKKKGSEKTVIPKAPKGEALLAGCVFPKAPIFCEGCWVCCWVLPNAEGAPPPKILVVPPPMITTFAQEKSRSEEKIRTSTERGERGFGCIITKN